MSLGKVLYRDLLLAARQFDRHVALRALVSSNLLQRPVAPGSTDRVRHLEALNRILLAFLERRSFYLPSPERGPLAQLVRDKFRTPEAARSSGEGVDLAFAALRTLTDTLAKAKEYHMLDASAVAEDDEHEDSVNELPVRNVQLAENVATGTFLLSHPLLGGTFRRAVVVLTEHGQKGSRGFIVNHVTNKPLSSTFRVHSRIIHAFGTSKVHRGGPVPTDHAEILHARPEFGGERVVTTNLPSANDDKLFVGLDLQTAAQAVEDKTALQSDVVFLNGVSTWTVGQLDNELQRGTWVAVKAPISLALNAKKELWQELMGALGGEYEAFSKMPVIYDDDFDDEDELEV